MTHTRSCNRRRMMQGGLLLAACGLLSSCASLIGPRKVEIPLHKLQAGLERRFPVNHRLMQIFDIRLSRPMLALQPELDRVALALDASVAPPFARDTWSGSVAFSGRLYVDPGRPAVMMAEPRVDRIAIGANPETERQLARVASTLIDTVVRDTPVYSFDPDDLRYAGVQYIPTRIETTRSGLLVTLEPAK
ncbi:DUF1439 domain-containing protein [Massilia sp. IC2-477]|uniref:DUF1439 domain-containing protein n=1 Tax=unclassified Massilia TaxID=2609279 RepID=UPI001D10C0F9|nr:MULTISPECIES: DUF1439 domain-containing protein [unclassified Massilia]MCC2954671.1 DUF1439 domain-containing protein [Massilia sp. IC2-477]MCC2972656.1 DUF1439 domain-containing protein [Massilia sp. IC2-476]